VPQQELMHRIKRCEDSLSAINHEKLSPFYQQEILDRIEALESQVGRNGGTKIYRIVRLKPQVHLPGGECWID